MYNTLLTLENQFFKLKYISDRNWLDKILHDDFKECGKSGRLFDKKETIESLIQCTADRNIVIYDFEYQTVNKACYIVHYITKHEYTKYYRTSVWAENESLQLLFHQASILTQ